ncbi:MAG TPA: bifunctional oligoribonuclease/PAP phosphatase NrnA [Desulfobacteraceae bacterium]|nr:bifunctional oligoribonuclease/PAP phosphatase NrnA [Desulfobacteraceae bacterium]HPQ27335.1 bifunctional oligoribonuclease/PAP phosphatase NrnA [Desulfobacteraceae bacterium]
MFIDSKPINFKKNLERIASVLQKGNTFLIMTHRDPDPDGIGSMLALGKALNNDGKEAFLVTEEPLFPPISRLNGAERIIQDIESDRYFDCVIVMDSGEVERVGGPRSYLEGDLPVINIDHHESNKLFGEINLVDSSSSSTAELVFYVIKAAGLNINSDAAEDIFAGIQADTGSFKYNNATASSLRIAADMIELGANPWQISRTMMQECSVSQLKLLQSALGSLEFYHNGEIGLMTLSLDMMNFERNRVLESNRFIDYPRFVQGVEIAVLIRQTGENDYKFSLRSNDRVNVARLSARFGGGGHIRAAGFECHGSLACLKDSFLKEAVGFLDETGG